jgi:hypothetical protein
MAVKILMKDVVIWESAGLQGVAIIQLEEFTSHLSRPLAEDNLALVHTSFLPEYVPAPGLPENFDAMDVTYTLHEALAKEFALRHEFTEPIRAGIQQAIYRLISAAMSEKLKASESGTNSKYIDGHFHDSDDLIPLVTQQLGLAWPLQCDTFSARVRTYSPRNESVADRGSFWLSPEIESLLVDSCGCREHRATTLAHENDDEARSFSTVNDDKCIWVQGSRLIIGVAATALALMQCVYDPLEVQVSATVFNGMQMTEWTNSVSRVPQLRLPDAKLAIFHLNDLLQGPLHARLSDETYPLLAISAGSYSIYYRCLLDEECFDKYGRVLAIASGRICMKRTLREYVKESAFSYPMNFVKLSSFEAGINTKHEPGLEIRPHYASSDIGIRMDCRLGETEILFSCWITSELQPMLAAKIGKSYDRLQREIVQPHCEHARDKALVVHRDMGPVVVSTFFGQDLQYEMYEGLQMFALRGCSLEQLVQIGLIPQENSCLQVNACLECTYKERRQFLLSKSVRPLKVVQMIMT